MPTDLDPAISAAFNMYEVDLKEREVKIWLLEAQPMSDKLDRYPGGAKERHIEEFRIEERRIAAVRKLRALYQSPFVDDRVRNFFNENWLRILRAPDPAAAAAELFNGKPRRGRKPDSTARNFRIARAVQERVDAGKTVEQACEAVRQQHAPQVTWERVREIYYGPTVDEEEKKNWQLSVGIRRPTLADLLPAIATCIRAVHRAVHNAPGKDCADLTDGEVMAFLMNTIEAQDVGSDGDHHGGPLTDPAVGLSD
jgi:hypothetical protein